ncbi:transcription factor IIIA isoform X2 [Hemicordylus capensis]|uniref:transcription factor IIIA isoform X2 n=1 Tax=Hemicordylus capensis TaxID=884348 RepID=UPI002302B6CC|nr:transcription factor IIIA isoform X2 [Hemicordylus capensis]
MEDVSNLEIGSPEIIGACLWRPFVCDFEGCNKGFTRYFHLKRHFLTHTGEKEFMCIAYGCNKRFTTRSNLNKHIERRHQQRQFVCDFEDCGESFKKHQQLRVHQAQHTSEPLFKCIHEGCGKSFSTPGHLKRHEKTHEGYLCRKDGCWFIANTWSELLKHMKYEHVEPVICNVCFKEFRRKDYLKAHQKTHDTDREVLKCPREGCGRTYTTLFNLQSHIASFHEEKRPFVCEHPGCGRLFAMKQSLMRHAVVHDPDRKKLNITPKKERPKRSLASRLSGYIPPKAPRKSPSSAEETLTTPAENQTLPTVETLSLD